CIQGSHLPYSF
nr:immunoglobulin light chain junction region [Macaca mulatta]